MASSLQDQVEPVGRALVPVRAQDNEGNDDRPLTDFLTQLIACQRQLPSYRRAWRAEPSHAISAYADHAGDGSPHLDRLV